MEGPAFTVSALVNRECFAKTMIDTGCLVSSLCDPQFATEKALKRIQVEPREIEGVTGKVIHTIEEVVVFDMDLDGHQEEVYAYVVPLDGYDLFLGMPWIQRRDVRVDGKRRRLKIGATKTIVKAKDIEQQASQPVQVSAASLSFLAKKAKKEGEPTGVFAASMADINKALATKTHRDPREKLPAHYHQFLDVFDRKEAEKLPPVVKIGWTTRLTWRRETTAN